MGEVYRADDLKLGQQVALKFLPEDFENDPERLQRFLGEVKTARQVTHPNVCRVYDVGEIEGRHFLSMEYIDGEDLASLLRRIGHLPHDKAVQISRQICAGLAAAHEKGILHRDLKPANIMLDGRGQVRLTDFGLAGLVDNIAGHEIRAGTPAYMAPEQLAGRDVSIQSDLYSLGLVLYEIFTGERAFKANTAAEMAESQQTLPTSPSNLVEGLDPAVERVILRCLDPEPPARPSSVLAVGGALPGADPLAAAQAAGETPSPEMVANAAEAGGLGPAVAAALLAVAFALILAALLYRPVGFLHTQVPFDTPPRELFSRAKSILGDLGYVELPQYESYGFRDADDLVDYLLESDPSPEVWEPLRNGRPPGILFWARLSPLPLQSSELHDHAVSMDNPPRHLPGSLAIELDTLGRLVHLAAVAPEKLHNPSDSTVDWPAVFDEAGLELDDFEPVQQMKVPPVPTDTVAAWKGTFAWSPEDGEAVIQAGSLSGRITYFEILGPHNSPQAATSDEVAASDMVIQLIGGLLMLSLYIGAILLARRNLKLGRGDRIGAARLGIFMLITVLATWLIVGVRFGGISAFDLVSSLTGRSPLGHALVHASLLWLMYVALEPYVRRIWPETLVSWTRLLRGRFQDPMIGRDILVGAVVGGLMAVLGSWVDHAMELWLLGRTRIPIGLGNELSWETSDWIGSLLWSIPDALTAPMAILTLLILARLILRRNWAAVVAISIIVGTLFVLESLSVSTQGSWILWSAIGVLIWLGLTLSTLVYFGLLATIVAFYFFGILGSSPFTLDMSAWYAPGSLIHIAVLVALPVYGFIIALGGKRLFSDPLEN